MCSCELSLIELGDDACCACGRLCLRMLECCKCSTTLDTFDSPLICVLLPAATRWIKQEAQGRFPRCLKQQMPFPALFLEPNSSRAQSAVS